MSAYHPVKTKTHDSAMNLITTTKWILGVALVLLFFYAIAMSAQLAWMSAFPNIAPQDRDTYSVRSYLWFAVSVASALGLLGLAIITRRRNKSK